MTIDLSPNAQAILLLAAPLIAGRGKPSVNPLSAGEYKRLARRLLEVRRQPGDLLGAEAGGVLTECGPDFDRARIGQLLGRGFLLGQALERWQARAIWVLSRADEGYPRRLKRRLGENAPPVLYGCGDAALLETGGLGVVGSRNAEEALLQFADGIGRLAAVARRTLVSGGARGIDQAAMQGAQAAGGRVVGVLSDSLEKAAMAREHRDALLDGRLVLVSPYDPAVRFHVGNAMQRNKLIYALADAALVVHCDHGKGGTWAGAVEQLDTLRYVPVYARSTGEIGEGLQALLAKGARDWPNPATPDDFKRVLDRPAPREAGATAQRSLFEDSPPSGAIQR